MTSQFMSVEQFYTGAVAPYSYGSDKPVHFADPSGARAPSGAQLCSDGNTATWPAASTALQCAPVGVVVPEKRRAGALTAISATADGTALMHGGASLGFCSTIVGALIVIPAAAGAAASAPDFTLTVTGHESEAQLLPGLLETLGVCDGRAGPREVGADAQLTARQLLDTSSLALGVRASVLAAWHRQARGGPHAARPSLEDICGV